LIRAASLFKDSFILDYESIKVECSTEYHLDVVKLNINFFPQ